MPHPEEEIRRLQSRVDELERALRSVHQFLEYANRQVSDLAGPTFGQYARDARLRETD